MYPLISSSVIYSATKASRWSETQGVWGGELVALYSVGVRVSHVEKVFGIGRVCLGLKDLLGASCTADAHGKSHAAHEEVHIVFRRKKAAVANVSVRQASVGNYCTLDR